MNERQAEKPRHAKLDEGERRQRPATTRRLTFEELATPGPTFRDTRYLIPIECVESGDVQVFAARAVRLGEATIDLDPLAALPTVRSIVASTTVQARTPLPHISELLLFGNTPLPDEQTLRNLPGLVRLWAGWAPGKPPLALEALPEGLEALGICRHSLGWVKSPSPRFASLTRFTKLRALTLNDCWPQDSVASLADLTGLVQLRSNAPLGWSALRTCTELEDVAAIRPRLANLRSLKTWTRLRRLTITGSGVRSLAGLEALTGLEELRLIMMAVDDLSPLADLVRLREIELTGLTRAHDLTPLGRLTSLRRLAIARAGIEYRDIVHVDSLRPLAGAKALEELTMTAAVVDDRDLVPLLELPSLRKVRLSGELGDAVDRFRTARPEVDVAWFQPGPPPGARVGAVFVRPPAEGIPSWWIREDLTELFKVQTNADAEQRLRTALAAEAPAVLDRLSFDTEGDAVCVNAPSDEDARLVAGVITRLTKR